MKISIITVVYNGAQNIEGTIHSVLAQDYPELEYIVVDGGSKDGTVQILEKYSDKIKWVSEKDKGIYDAMNKGLSLATGEVIGFIGSDDFYPSHDVVSSVALQFTEGVDAVYGNKQYVSQHDDTKITRLWHVGPYKKSNWLRGWMPPHLSFYLRKKHYDRLGTYNITFRNSGDYELMLRMLYKHELHAVYLDKMLMTMREGGSSNATLKHRWIANQEDRRAWKVNQLKPKWYTLWWKPLSKIPQLFIRK